MVVYADALPVEYVYIEAAHYYVSSYEQIRLFRISGSLGTW